MKASFMIAAPTSGSGKTTIARRLSTTLVSIRCAACCPIPLRHANVTESSHWAIESLCSMARSIGGMSFTTRNFWVKRLRAPFRSIMPKASLCLHLFSMIRMSLQVIHICMKSLAKLHPVMLAGTGSDVANYIPARLTALLMIAPLLFPRLGEDSGRKNPSPSRGRLGGGFFVSSVITDATTPRPIAAILKPHWPASWTVDSATRITISESCSTSPILVRTTVPLRPPT